jgi:catechol 2,3-dioxygenase-like lactoylglutathione lyase family enzyme
MLAARLIVHPTIAPAFLPVKTRRDYYPFTMAFTLDRLDHLVLTVANIDATVDFYTEVLGMEAVTTNGRKSLTFGVQTIKLHQRGHEFNPKAAHPMPGSGDLCFITETPLDEVMTYLGQLRIHVEDGPVERDGAMGRIRSVYLRDPDRNLVEVSNYL